MLSRAEVVAKSGSSSAIPAAPVSRLPCRT